MGRKLFADLLHGFLLLLGRHIAPSALVANIFTFHFAWSATARRRAALRGVERAIATGIAWVASLATILAILIASILRAALAHAILAVGSIFHFFDELIQRGDNTVFLDANLFTGMTEIKPARHVVHSPRDVIERFIL